MVRLQSKQLDEPDEIRQISNGTIRIYQMDDFVIGLMEFRPGWRWSTDVKPTAGTEWCMYHHVGIVMSGRMGIRLADGTSQEIAPGTAYEIPPGHDAWVIGDEPWVTYDFAGMRSFGRPVDAGERSLASILFTDVVDSTATLERVGDRRWRELISQLDELTQLELDRYRGRLVSKTGDGALATFDGAERAVRCAAAICRAAEDHGLSLRAAVHTGEVERVGSDLRGVAVHVAARILSLAGASEVLVSSTTEELVAGSGLVFEDRGEHELKGISGRRRVMALVRAEAAPTS